MSFNFFKKKNKEINKPAEPVISEKPEILTKEEISAPTCLALYPCSIYSSFKLTITSLPINSNFGIVKTIDNKPIKKTITPVNHTPFFIISFYHKKEKNPSTLGYIFIIVLGFVSNIIFAYSKSRRLT